MSIKIDQGQNISTAVNVLLETYKHLNLLFTEMDALASEEGFIPLTPKFLRWKSDTSFEGWLTSNFIKLYQIESHAAVAHLSDLNEGDLFIVEIDLNSEEGYPEITLGRLSYDYHQWTRMPAVSDHWIFWDIFRNENHFQISEENGRWESQPYKKSVKKYWGIQEAVGITLPLVEVTSSETIRRNIFQNLKQITQSFKREG